MSVSPITPLSPMSFHTISSSDRELNSPVKPSSNNINMNTLVESALDRMKNEPSKFDEDIDISTYIKTKSEFNQPDQYHSHFPESIRLQLQSIANEILSPPDQRINRIDDLLDSPQSIETSNPQPLQPEKSQLLEPLSPQVLNESIILDSKAIDPKSIVLPKCESNYNESSSPDLLYFSDEDFGKTSMSFIIFITLNESIIPTFP